MTALSQHPIVREALGAAACALWLAAVEAAGVAVARRSERAARRLEPWLTAAAALWLVFAFRVVAYFPTAVAVALAGVFMSVSADRVAARDAGPGRVRSPRAAFHGVTAAMALVFWQQGWMFNMIGPLVAHVCSRAAQEAARRRFGRRRFRAVDAHTLEGMTVYAAVTLAIQLAVYWNWSRIPGFAHEPRAVLWALLGGGAATVARLYTPITAAEWVVPMANAAAIYLYAMA